MYAAEAVAATLEHPMVTRRRRGAGEARAPRSGRNRQREQVRGVRVAEIVQPRTNVDFELARRRTAHAVRAVRDGIAGYTLLVAEKR